MNQQKQRQQEETENDSYDVENQSAPVPASPPPPKLVISNVPRQLANDTSKPITALAKHRLREGAEDLFEQWVKDITNVQTNIEGYLGSEVIHPFSQRSHSCRSITASSSNNYMDSREYISIFRYDTYENLKNWMESDIRAQFIERAKEFSEIPVMVTYHSLEHWFVHNADKDADDFSVASSKHNNSKGAATSKPPAKYKMVVVVFLVIWFQLHFILPITIRKISALSPLASEGLGTLQITTLTTFVFMPVCTRILAFWLFPGCDYLKTLSELIPPPLLRRLRACQQASSTPPEDTSTIPGSSKHQQQQEIFQKAQHAPSQITTKTSSADP